MGFLDIPSVKPGALDASVRDKINDTGSLSRGALNATYATPRFARPKPSRLQPQVTVNTTFQTGHGYVANSGTWTADTAVFALGTQSIRTTATTTSSTYRKLAQPALDLSGKDFAALIKVDDPTLLSQIHLYLGKNSLASYEPVQAALGGISANSTILPDTWTWVYFSWGDAGNPVGTPDRTAITDWQIRVLGNSTTPVTVWVNAIGHYPRREAFPTGCVSFACDDGRLSQITRMAPALDKYGYGATAYLIVEALGTAGKGTYDQFKALEANNRWEIAGHSYTSAAHNNGMTSLSLAALDTELRTLRDWLQQGNHKGADLFAYPLGFDNPDVIEVVSRYFTNARQIVRAPFQNADLDQPYRMRSNSISSSDALATAKVWVDKAVANGTWLTITMHDIVDGAPAAGTEWNTADFQELVDYVAASGAEVMPVGAALDRVDANQPSPITGPTGPTGPAGPVPITSVRKAADTTVNNSITLTADPELTIPVVAGGIYHVEGFLIYSSATAADMSLGWTYPASSTMDWTSNGLISTITGNTGSLYRGRLAINGVGWAGGSGAGAGSKLVALPAGILTAAASGNLTLTWAQLVADASDTVIYANSTLKLTKLN